MLDPERGDVHAVDPAADPRLPGLAAALSPGSRLVSYRAGRRAVVLRPDGGFVKIVRPSRASRVVELHRRAEDAVAGVAVPVVRWSELDGRIGLSTVSGGALHERLVEDPPGLVDDLTRVGAALASFHLLAPTVGLEQRVGDRPEEWVSIVARAEPAAVTRLSEVAAALPDLPPGGDTVVHGDLHDKNLLLDAGGGVGLIDLDGLALGRAEDDLGNLTVHLALRAMQAGRPDEVGTSWSRVLLMGAVRRRPVDEERIRAVARHTWFRLACLYRFRRSGRHLVDRMLARAAGA